MPSKKTIRKLQRLVAKYRRGTATPAEREFVEAYYDHFHTAEPGTAGLGDTERRELETRIFGNLQARIQQAPQRPALVLFLQRRVKTGIAASVLLLVLAGLWYRWPVAGNKGPSPVFKQAATVKSDVGPGGDKAILTLANGRKIVLDSLAAGRLAQQGNADIIKHANGEIVYKQAGAPEAIFYNTMSTQTGGQYRLQLPDGTKVWLNSMSSITYPTAFTGGERKVDITGEAYFEVAQDLRKPFQVSVRGMDVEVLGTHFNVMAYADEAMIRTTLLEGSVKVSAGGEQVLLKPGQQAIQGGGMKVKEVDADQETAWISGFFQFNHTDLPSLMRQLNRWYGVDPVYVKADNGRKFGGRISKNLNLSEVLHMLEGNNIHFTIEGKKLIVQP